MVNKPGYKQILPSVWVLVQMKLRTSYFQSVHVLIFYIWFAKNFMKAYTCICLVAVFMLSLIIHQSKRGCPYARRQDYGTGMIVFLPSLNTLRFKSQKIPTFSFYIDWFKLNYKDQTDSKLPKSGLCFSTDVVNPAVRDAEMLTANLAVRLLLAPIAGHNPVKRSCIFCIKI